MVVEPPRMAMRFSIKTLLFAKMRPAKRCRTQNDLIPVLSSQTISLIADHIDFVEAYPSALLPGKGIYCFSISIRQGSVNMRLPFKSRRGGRPKAGSSPSFVTSALALEGLAIGPLLEFARGQMASLTFSASIISGINLY